MAGALDTYAKAILCDSPVYFSMVLPEPARELAWQTGLAPYQEVELEDSPFWTLGFHWHRPAWQAEWSVMNLLPDGAEGYTGTLFFSPLSEDNTYGIVYQQVAVRPDGDFWTVEPLGELEALRLPDEGAIPAPDDHIPHITYAAETVDLRLEVDLTYFLTCSDIWVGYMSRRRLGRRQDVPHRRRRPSQPRSRPSRRVYLLLQAQRTEGGAQIRRCSVRLSVHPRRALRSPFLRWLSRF